MKKEENPLVTNSYDLIYKGTEMPYSGKYVNNKGFKKLLRTKPCKTKSDAFKYEYQIKQLKRHEKLGWFD